MHDDGPGIGTFIACAFCIFIGVVVGAIMASDSNSKKTNEWEKKYKELTLSYETLQCSHRGLDLTTVKGITLCMNRDTKALHKIDEKAD